MSNKGVWGRSSRSKTVHFYPGGGQTSLCGLSKHLDMQAPDEWDESNPLTCENCKRHLSWFRQGFRPVKTTS